MRLFWQAASLYQTNELKELESLCVEHGEITMSLRPTTDKFKVVYFTSQFVTCGVQ